jgi:hypothetical protein
VIGSSCHEHRGIRFDIQEILAKYKTQFPPVGDGWIFRGEKMLRPLDLDNLSRRVIPHFINGAWFG